MLHTIIQNYIEELDDSLKKICIEDIEKIVEILWDAYLNQASVYICGNGGSAATASHFACDLGKNTAQSEKPRFRVTSINDNMSLFSAIGNDLGYDMVFAEQLRNLLTPNDILIAISGSGNSQNVINAILYAKEIEATSIGILGFDGGKMKELVDLCLWIENYSYAQVEDLHLVITHIITEIFKQRIENHNPIK